MALFLVNMLQSALSAWICVEVKTQWSRTRQLYSIYTWVPINAILYLSVKLIWGIVWYIDRSKEGWQKDRAWQYITIAEFAVNSLDAVWICFCSYVFITHANKEVDKDLHDWKPVHREHRRRSKKPAAKGKKESKEKTAS